MKRPFSFVAAVLGVCVALALALAALWAQMGWRGVWQPPAAQPPQLDDLLANIPAAMTAVETVPSVLTGSPPFFISRRPPPAKGADVAKKEDKPEIELDKIRFYGIVSGPALKAVMAEVQGKAHSVRIGEQVVGWELVSIEDRKITFAKGAQRRELELAHAHTALKPADKPAESPASKP